MPSLQQAIALLQNLINDTPFPREEDQTSAGSQQIRRRTQEGRVESEEIHPLTDANTVGWIGDDEIETTLLMVASQIAQIMLVNRYAICNVCCGDVFPCTFNGFFAVVAGDDLQIGTKAGGFYWNGR